MNKVISFFLGFIFWRADDATCGTSTWIGKGFTCYCFKRKGNYERICVTLTPAQVNELIVGTDGKVDKGASDRSGFDFSFFLAFTFFGQNFVQTLFCYTFVLICLEERHGMHMQCTPAKHWTGYMTVFESGVLSCEPLQEERLQRLKHRMTIYFDPSRSDHQVYGHFIRHILVENS